MQVTYEQFWQRHFYRCDVERIIQDWRDEDDRVRIQRQELMKKGVQSVQNIFGGALKAIKGVASSDHSDINHSNANGTSILEKYQAELEEKQKALMQKDVVNEEDEKINSGKKKGSVGGGILGGALGMFGGGNGRPPFVLNTAESDDDYDVEDNNDVEGNSMEEEEDFGWGSDEEEEEEEEEEEVDNEYEQEEESVDNSLDETQEIVFGDKGSTSDEVLSEIKNLKVMLEDAQHAKHEAILHAQKLQEQVNGLDEELELIRRNNLEQKYNDDDHDDHDEIKLRNEENALLVQEAQDQIKILILQVQEVEGEKVEGEKRVHHLMEKLASCKDELESEKQKSSKTLKESISKVELEHSDIVKLCQETIRNLECQLKSFETEMDQTKQRENKLMEDLDACQTEMKNQNLTFAKTLEDQIALVRAEYEKGVDNAALSPALVKEGSSFSSGIEVVPSEEEMPKEAVKDAADDDWGDSWSDDDGGDE